MYTQFYRFLKQLPAVLGKIRKTAKKLLPNFPFSCILYKQHYDGPLAQLVEHLTLNQGVVGSRPTWVTKIWPVGQAVKTPPFHGGNAGSIPARVTNIKKLFIMKGFFLLLYYPRLRVNSIASLPVICSILISIQDRAFHSRLISFSTAVTSLLYFKPKTFVA